MTSIYFFIKSALFLSLVSQPVASSEPLRIAVASNFSVTARALAERFEDEYGHLPVVIPGSTGKHFAQIQRGAPFDIFMAADVERPALLERDGLIIDGSRVTYAVGRLALWTASEDIAVDSGRILNRSKQYRFAMANPILAPYGRAAKEVLLGLGLWDDLGAQMIRGENISQVHHFVSTGGVVAGFISWSGIVADSSVSETSYWLIPENMYTPIEQQAVVLRQSDMAERFMSFMASEIGRAIISSHGYTLEGE